MGNSTLAETEKKGGGNNAIVMKLLGFLTTSLSPLHFAPVSPAANNRINVKRQLTHFHCR